MTRHPRLEPCTILHWLLPVALYALLGGCASQPKDFTEADASRIPDAVPKVEPLSKSGNPRSYVVFGKRYYTKKNSRGYVERGTASWYGKQFHGRKTSSGEIYDMYAMSAAHKTLPLPTYARVTNLENRRSAVVRINDRGPFHDSRIIDLSYSAARKLGIAKSGTAEVEVRAIDPRRYRSKGQRRLAAAGATRPRSTQGVSGNYLSPNSTYRLQPAYSKVHTGDQGRAAVHQPPEKSASKTGALYLQVGAFGDPRNAEKLRSRLSHRLDSSEVQILAPEGSDAALYKVRIGPLQSEQEAARVAHEISALGVSSTHRTWSPDPVQNQNREG